MSEIAKPRACADVAVFGRFEYCTSDQILLVRRGEEPFKGMLCLPGGLIFENEQPQEAAIRKVAAECGIALRDLRQALTLSDPCFDPRGWTISVLFVGTMTRNQSFEAVPGPAEAGTLIMGINAVRHRTDVVPGFQFLIGRLYQIWLDSQ